MTVLILFISVLNITEQHHYLVAHWVPLNINKSRTVAEIHRKLQTNGIPFIGHLQIDNNTLEWNSLLLLLESNRLKCFVKTNRFYYAIELTEY